jgi:hypothetical protein
MSSTVTAAAHVFPADEEILTVAEAAEFLKCPVRSIYTMTCKRAQTRYANPIPVMRMTYGLRFRKSALMAWLLAHESAGSPS